MERQQSWGEGNLLDKRPALKFLSTFNSCQVHSLCEVLFAEKDKRGKAKSILKSAHALTHVCSTRSSKRAEGALKLLCKQPAFIFLRVCSIYSTEKQFLLVADLLQRSLLGFCRHGDSNFFLLLVAEAGKKEQLSARSCSVIYIVGVSGESIETWQL